MELLSRGNSFQATQWLKNPHKELGNKSPAQLIKEEKIEIVFEIHIAGRFFYIRYFPQ